MSFDVEDWYHCLDSNPSNWHQYEDRIVFATRKVLEILDLTDTKATFFVLGHVAALHPELVEEIDERGHEIGTHGSDHRFVYQQTEDEFEDDVRRSIKLLESIVNKPIRCYRAPYFSITKKSIWALDILQKLGIDSDSSIFPVINHRYGIPDAPRLPYRTENGILEVPLSTFRVGGSNFPVSGGVYFRFLPYRLLRVIFNRLARQKEPLIFYLHPWELDPGQPRNIQIPASLRFRHYWALKKTGDKLARLLRDFRFGPMRDLKAS